MVHAPDDKFHRHHSGTAVYLNLSIRFGDVSRRRLMRDDLQKLLFIAQHTAFAGINETVPSTEASSLASPCSSAAEY